MSNQAINALDRYTAAFEAIEDHKNKHSMIFAEHQKLMYALIDAENALRDLVAEQQIPVSNEAFRVTIHPQTQTYADIEELDRCVASGVIQLNHRNLIVRTIPRPPRISITKQRDL